MLRASIAVALTAVALAGCGGGGSKSSSSSKPKPGGVTMQNIQFKPTAMRVKLGRVVTWTNRDSVDHNVTATKGAKFASKAFGQGGTFRFTPHKAGTVDYVCTLHPGMKAKLIVTR